MVGLGYFSPKMKTFSAKKSFDSISLTSSGKTLMRLTFYLGCEPSKAMKMLQHLSTHKRLEWCNERKEIWTKIQNIYYDLD